MESYLDPRPPQFNKSSAISSLPTCPSDGLVPRLDQNLIDTDVLLLTNSENDRAGYVLGLQDLGPGGLAVLLDGLLIRAHAQKVGLRVAGLNARHPESCPRRLESQRLERRFDEELGGRVYAQAREYLAARVRRDGDDVARTPGEHGRHDGGETVEETFAVDVHGSLPLFGK